MVRIDMYVCVHVDMRIGVFACVYVVCMGVGALILYAVYMCVSVCV